MKNKYQYLCILIILVSVAAGVAAGRYLVPKYPKVIEATDGVVVYENGTAEVLIRDAFEEDAWRVYRASVEPLYVPFGKQNWGWGPEGYNAPTLVGRGGNQNRLVFTYNDYKDECHKNIFYINRVTHEAHTTKTALCVDRVLDEHDVTRFLGVGMENSEQGLIQHIGMGVFETGNIIASTTLPRGYTAAPGISDWEIRHYVFFAVKGYRELEDFTLYSFDTETQVLSDITSQVPPIDSRGLPAVRYVRNYGDTSGSFVLAYESDDGVTKNIPLVIP